MKLPKSLLPPKQSKPLVWPIIVRRVAGHSMVPVLPPGTYIWASRWFRGLKTGDIVVFLHDGREKIKRISEIKDSELYVLGDHPESSTDSRQFGWINRDTVTAKLFWPHAPRTRAENVKAVKNNTQTSPDK